VNVLDSPGAFSLILEAARGAGRSVGLVPTMGALHAGHESLIVRAAAECDTVAVSIFVNPLQFGDPADLDRYPRSVETDLEVCRRLGVSVVFVPTVAAMYPGWPGLPATVVSVGPVAAPWEGASRPGHFEGVATVVAKLFALAGRCRAYFGDKDFQQVAVVRRMAADLCFPVEVVGCPTVREPDGLALSSRNALLSVEERRSAPVLWRALIAGRRAVEAGERDPAAVAAVVAGVVGAAPLVSLDYAALVDPSDLTVPPVVDTARDLRLIIAARLGTVRLIDNEPATALVPAPQTVPGQAALAGARPAG
jgi:pantoate--beta-alanine ligase